MVILIIPNFTTYYGFRIYILKRSIKKKKKIIYGWDKILKKKKKKKKNNKR